MKMMRWFRKTLQQLMVLTLAAAGAGSASAMQLVVLDFDSGTDGSVVYSQSMRDAIQARMEQHYVDFDVVFTQDLNPVGDKSRITFNAGSAGGLAEGIDFRNLNKNDNAVVNVVGLVNTADQTQIIGASATIGSHELGHLLGLRHADSMGAIGKGLPSTGSPALNRYRPAYPGPQLAGETTDHLMASPASVGSSLADLFTPSWFGERSAIKLSLIDQGSVQVETAGNTNLILDRPAVPNTIVSGDNAGLNLNVKTFVAAGSLSAASEADLFSFSGLAGEVFTFEVMSNVLQTRIPEGIDSFLTVLDASSNPVPYFGSAAENDDEFETTDSHIIDLTLPADGTYSLRVRAFSPRNLGSYEVFGQTLTALDPEVENLPPNANPVNVMTSEGNAVEVTLSGSDPEGEPLEFAISSPPARGVLSGMAPVLTYTPNPGVTGADSFSYTVSDGINTSEPATVTILIAAANQPPVADDQSLSVAAGGSVVFELTGSDPDGDPLQFAIATGPAQGVLSGMNPELTYTPTPGFSGADSFTFTVSDGEATSLPGVVSITVTGSGQNNVPVANPQAVTASQGFQVSILLTGTDLDGDPLSFNVESFPANGVLGGAAPTLNYTGDPGFVGQDSFTFSVSDGVSTSEPATVSITVVNDRADIACGRPAGLDRTSDPGSFLWQDCTDSTPMWFFQVNGGGLPSNRTSSGSFEVIGGLQNLQQISIESRDRVDTSTDPNALWFDLTVRGGGVDRLEFLAPPNTCFLPAPILTTQLQLAESIFLGADRVPLLAGSFSLDTGLACLEVIDSDGDGLSDEEEAALGTNPLVADTDGGGVDDGDEVANSTDPLDPNDDFDRVGAECFEPEVNRATEEGLFVWKACDGSNTWSVLFSGGDGGRAVYEGELTGGEPAVFEPVLLNRNDRVDVLGTGLSYRVIVSNGGRDLFRFVPVSDSCLRTGTPGVSVLLGVNKIPARGSAVNLDDPTLLCSDLMD